MDNKKMNKHEWKYIGCHPHNGEYIYKCTKCGKSDWVAYYGNENQLSDSDCKPKEEPIIYNI